MKYFVRNEKGTVWESISSSLIKHLRENKTVISESVENSSTYIIVEASNE